MHTLLLCTSYLSCSFPIRRAADIFKDADCLLLWSSDLLAGRLIRSASVARVCVAPAICVSSSWTTLYARVCVCVCGSTLSLPVKSSAVAPAVLEGYHLCVCVNVCFLASVPWTTRVPLSWPCTFESAPLSHVSTTWNIPTFTRRLTWALCGRPTLCSFHSASNSTHSLVTQITHWCFSTLPCLLPALSVSTCHWALCFISTWGDQNEGYWVRIWSEHTE